MPFSQSAKRFFHKLLSLCDADHQPDRKPKLRTPASPPTDTTPLPPPDITIECPRIREPGPGSSIYSRPSDGGSTYTTKARRAHRPRLTSSVYSRKTTGTPYSTAGRSAQLPPGLRSTATTPKGSISSQWTNYLGSDGSNLSMPYTEEEKQQLRETHQMAAECLQSIGITGDNSDQRADYERLQAECHNPVKRPRPILNDNE
ncbi:MAG: hypothetical protein Q9219_005531 [cf. Caloplaca sp. 3 TL-2023]